MDMTVFVERRHQTFFARVAQANWWRFESKGNGQIEFHVDKDRLCGTLPEVQQDAARLLAMVDAVQKVIPYASLHTNIISIGKLLVTGPKLFRVNRETCEALAQVVPEIEIADYRQPYEAMIVEFDQKWVESLGTPPDGIEAPHYCVLWHQESIGMVVSTLLRDGNATGLSMILIVGGRCSTIEQTLHVDDSGYGGSAKKSDTDYAYQLHRVALNYALLTTHLGTASTGWADPKWRAKHERLKGERGELFRLGDIELMDLAQHIQLVRRERIRGGGTEGDGTPKKPHWRKGHWRSQPFGIARTQRKLVFIAPVFIHLELVGDLSRTSVTYH